MTAGKILEKGLKTAALAAAAGAAVSYAEKNLLSTVCYELDSHGKLDKDITAVFLTDLHEKEFGDGNFRLLHAIYRAEPDLILIGGDMPVVKERACCEVSLRLIRTLAAKYPVFYGSGNHELRWDRDRGVYGDSYDRYRAELEECGVIFLGGMIKDASDLEGEGRKTCRVSCDFGSGLMISGLDLTQAHYHRFTHAQLDEAYIRDHIGEPDQSCYNIVLVHSPEFHEPLAGFGADLILSGHFHGGTIRLPGDLGLMTPQYQFFKNNVTGIRYHEGVPMVISSGLGTHSINIRINDRPQTVILHIRH